jgi:hypothetical protein
LGGFVRCVGRYRRRTGQASIERGVSETSPGTRHPLHCTICYSHVTVISILGGGTIFLGEGVNSGACCPPERIHCSLIFQLLVQPTEHWNSITRRGFLSSPSPGSCPMERPRPRALPASPPVASSRLMCRVRLLPQLCGAACPCPLCAALLSLEPAPGCSTCVLNHASRCGVRV